MLGLTEKFDVINKRRSQHAPWHAHKTSPSGAYLDYKLEEGQGGVIDIYTITGQLLFEKVLNNNNSKLIINTSNLNSGLYFYKVIVDETIIVNEKLMIIK